MRDSDAQAQAAGTPTRSQGRAGRPAGQAGLAAGTARSPGPAGPGGLGIDQHIRTVGPDSA
jgi:hypothetical protein